MDISSRDLLQGYMMKLFLSLDFIYLLKFPSCVNNFHIFAGFCRYCAAIKLMLIFYLFIFTYFQNENTFHGFSFGRKTEMQKIENL